MAFQDSSGSFTKTRVVVLLLAGLATASLGAYHVRQARTTDAFSRPPMTATHQGPALVEGLAGGTAFELADGTSVLLAQLEVRDRAPHKKGSAIVCSRVLVERLTVGGQSVVLDPAAGTPSNRPFLLGGDHVGYLDLSREIKSFPHARLGEYCAADAVRRAKHVVVRAVFPGDTVTSIGCAKEGVLVPCHDGYDVFSGRPRAAAAGAMREGLIGFLLVATFLGCPSLVALIVLLSQRTASLGRPAAGAVS